MDVKIVSGWLTAAATAASLLAASAKGMYEYGVDNRMWGHRIGTIERVNAFLAPKYMMASPVTEAEFVISPDHMVRAKAYKDGVVAIYQLVNDDTSPMGYRQTLIFLTPKPWDTILEEIENVGSFSLMRNAYAAGDTEPEQKRTHRAFKDEILESDESGMRVKIKRTYIDGCIESFWVYIPTGEIQTEGFETTCSNR